MNSILASLLIISLVTLSYGAPKTVLNSWALENPDLYGGDMRGIDFNGFRKKRLALPAEYTLVRRPGYFGVVLWPEGKVPYVIDDSLAKQTNLIKSAMQEYHDKTCVRFVPRSDEKNYIKIKFDKSGCNSKMGVYGGEQAVNLGKNCHSKGIVMHELGHVLGFMHEHQRSDRDQFVTIIEDNIEDKRKKHFTKYNEPDNRVLGKFDYKSVMLYGPTSFSKDGRSETIKPRQEHQGYQIKNLSAKTSLSNLDVEAINKLYTNVKCGEIKLLRYDLLSKREG